MTTHPAALPRLNRGLFISMCLALVGGAEAPARSGSAQVTAPRPPVQVQVETALGNIVIELDSEHAPATTANFIGYVDGGFYDGGRFHRTVTMANQPDDKARIEVVQAGVDPAREKDVFRPVALERTNLTGLAHKDGTISMARGKPDSATTDFFICIHDQPSLDFGGARNPDGQGFAAFGRVVSGMDVVRAIQSAPAKGQKLTPPVTIHRILRLPA